MPPVFERRAHRTPGRHTHWRVARRRHLLLRGGTAAALIAVIGPGLLAGLSDDDPAGITTYSILGAKYGYELLWVLALSTAALIVFHELVHALEDQHYDFRATEKPLRDADRTDRWRAYRALVEGSAQLHTDLWVDREPGRRKEIFKDILDRQFGRLGS